MKKSKDVDKVVMMLKKVSRKRRCAWARYVDYEKRGDRHALTPSGLRPLLLLGFANSGDLGGVLISLKPLLL